MTNNINGILNINKPVGISSFSVIRKIGSILKGTKAGHAGTLDPDASGVLLILLGEATKLFSMLSHMDKEYIGELTLGISTDTQDATGKILKKKDVHVDFNDINMVFEDFIGQYEQTPPMASAKRYKGRRLYDLHRMGISVDRKKSLVHIRSLKILDYNPPIIKFRVTCSKGTYIRTLAHDIGERLGCGAYLLSLTRTRAGNFNISDALSLNANDLDIKNNVIPLKDVLSISLPSIIVHQPYVRKILNGSSFNSSNILYKAPCDSTSSLYAVYDPLQNPLAIARREDKSDSDIDFKLVRVFNKYHILL